MLRNNNLVLMAGLVRDRPEEILEDAIAELRAADASAHRPAAVDGEDVAGDQRRRGRGEEDHRAGHLDRRADAVQRRDPPDGVRAERRVCERRLGPGRSR